MKYYYEHKKNAAGEQMKSIAITGSFASGKTFVLKISGKSKY